MNEPRAINRGGVKLSASALAVLTCLVQADGEAVSLLHVDPRIVRNFENRDWIVTAFRDNPQQVYLLTRTGLAAYQRMLHPARHTDGLCPACRKRPVALSSGGRKKGYCADCLKERGKETYQRRKRETPGNPYRYRADSPCSRCGQQPRQVSPDGYVRPYCAACLNERRLMSRARRNRRVLEAAAAGLPVPRCPDCRTNPIWIQGETVYAYCRECQQQRSRQSNKRYRLKRALRQRGLTRDSATLNERR